MDDSEIIELYFLRDQRAVSETETKYGAYLMKIAENILKNRLDSQEAVNDTYFAAWNGIPPARPTLLRCWLGRVTRNLSFKLFDRTHAAKRNRDAELMLSELSDCLPDKRFDVERTLEAKRTGEIINEFLFASKREDCAIFVSRYFFVMSIAEIAARYGLTDRRVKYRLSVMRSGLRAALEKEGIEI